MAFSKIIMDGTTLMDVTEDTVESGKLLSGEKATKNDGTKVTGEYQTDGDVIFIDYDGSTVATKTKAQINAMTSDSELPDNPSHTGLVAQGWNWTVAQLKAQLTAMPDDKVYVGQMYTTASGATEIDVEMEDGRLSPIMTICVNGTITVDWGDGTTPDTVTGTSLTSRKAVGPHSYASDGNYTIKINKTSGTGYGFYLSTSYQLLRKNTTTSENRVYAMAVKRIRIGESCEINDYAFNYLQDLRSITLPNTVTSIGIYAFSNCYSIKSITIPKTVTSLGYDAFYLCYSAKNVSIPCSVMSIGKETFSNCYSLKTITIPSTVTSIGNYALYYCHSLEHITIPNGVTSIGNNIFQQCVSLNNLTIPNSVTTLPGYIAPECYSLNTVTLPNTITSIGDYIFNSCYSLRNITIPNTVTTIGNNAFAYCHSIATITIPSNVDSMGNKVFYSCGGLKEVHMLPTTPPTLGANVFQYLSSDFVIYVPAGKLNDYQTATNWVDYASKMQEEPQ